MFPGDDFFRQRSERSSVMSEKQESWRKLRKFCLKNNIPFNDSSVTSYIEYLENELEKEKATNRRLISIEQGVFSMLTAIDPDSDANTEALFNFLCTVNNLLAAIKHELVPVNREGIDAIFIAVSRTVQEWRENKEKIKELSKRVNQDVDRMKELCRQRRILVHGAPQEQENLVNVLKSVGSELPYHWTERVPEPQ